MDTKQRRIAQLASIIHSETLKIDQYLESQDKPSPSTNIDSPATVDLPDDLISSRNAVLDATDELNYLLTGPLQFITNVTASLHATIQALYRFPIATSFPVGSTTTFNALSLSIGLSEPDTTRLVRMAITHRIFREPRKGVIEHTALSALIARSPGLRQYMGLASEESWRATSRVIDAMQRWPNSEDSSQTGYNIATGGTLPYFEGIKADPLRAKRFDDTMSFAHAGGGFERALLTETYEWPRHEGATVVDLGGSQAAMCVDLARKYPGLRLVSQDLPDVIAGVGRLPDDVKDRVELMAHDFFEEQPVKGADVYLFRWIFHDWADGKAKKILRALIPALKKGSRVVIGDVCLPEPGTVPLFVDRRLRGFDLHMKAVLNSLERDAEQWESLLSDIDPSMRFTGVKQHPKSRWAVMECIWNGDGAL